MAKNLQAVDIFNRSVYKTVASALNQNVDLFNAATRGAIRMMKQDIQGSFQETAGLTLKDIVLFRDPTSTGAIAKSSFESVLDNMFKIGFSTKEIEYTYAKFDWIKQNPAMAGVIIGSAIARETLKNSVELAITSLTTVLKADASVTTNISAVGDGKVTWKSFVDASRPFGDQHDKIVAWVVNSAQLFDLFGSNLTNQNRLFQANNAVVYQDPMGRPIIATDLIELDGSNYNSLGLVSGAVIVGNMEDFRDNLVTKNGEANLAASYQGEWSQTLNVKNHRFDTAQTPAITKAKVAQSSNWTKISADKKDQAGVLLISK